MEKIIFYSSFILFFLACENNVPKPACELNNTFSLECTNGSNDTYAVYVNNVYKVDIRAKNKRTIDVPAGFAKIEVVQKDGYILYPTKKTYENTASACDIRYMVFP
jgi:hypothetical protein